MTDNKKVALIKRIIEQDTKYTKLENKPGLKAYEKLDSEILLTIDWHLTIYKSCK